MEGGALPGQPVPQCHVAMPHEQRTYRRSMRLAAFLRMLGGSAFLKIARSRSIKAGKRELRLIYEQQFRAAEQPFSICWRVQPCSNVAKYILWFTRDGLSPHPGL